MKELVNIWLYENIQAFYCHWLSPTFIGSFQINQVCMEILSVTFSLGCNLLIIRQLHGILPSHESTHLAGNISVTITLFKQFLHLSQCGLSNTTLVKLSSTLFKTPLLTRPHSSDLLKPNLFHPIYLDDNLRLSINSVPSLDVLQL